MNIDYESLATAAQIIRAVRAETFEGFLDTQSAEDSYVYGRATASCEVAYIALRELLALCSGMDARAEAQLEQLTNVSERASFR